MNETFSEIDLRKLDLNLLLVFSALMREGSVRKAADRLYLGPSAVSMALGRLRDAVDDPLFVRGAAGMEPTPTARTFWETVEPALNEIDAGLRASRRFDPATASMTVRLAAPDDLEFILVPNLLARLAREAPGIVLIVRPSDHLSMLSRLDEGDADLALSAAPPGGGDRRHHVETLYREGFSVLFDAKQIGPLPDRLDLQAYLEHDHLILSVTGDPKGAVDRVLAAQGKARRIVCAVSHFPTVPFILKTRPVFISMPSTAAHYFAQTYGLQMAPLPVPTPFFDVTLAWHARTHTDPAHQWLRRHVREAMVEIRATATLAGAPLG